jgi:hypothetical protein
MPFDVSGGTLKIRVKCSVSVMVCLEHLRKIQNFTIVELYK